MVCSSYCEGAAYNLVFCLFGFYKKLTPQTTPAFIQKPNKVKSVAIQSVRKQAQSMWFFEKICFCCWFFFLVRLYMGENCFFFQIQCFLLHHYLSLNNPIRSALRREGISSDYWHKAETSYLPNQISNNMQSLYTISAEPQTRPQCDILSGICCSNWINTSTHMLPINRN